MQDRTTRESLRQSEPLEQQPYQPGRWILFPVLAAYEVEIPFSQVWILSDSASELSLNAQDAILVSDRGEVLNW